MRQTRLPTVFQQEKIRFGEGSGVGSESPAQRPSAWAPKRPPAAAAKRGRDSRWGSRKISARRWASPADACTTRVRLPTAFAQQDSRRAQPTDAGKLPDTRGQPTRTQPLAATAAGRRRRGVESASAQFNLTAGRAYLMPAVFRPGAASGMPTSARGRALPSRDRKPSADHN
jgi:hypothetical protein